MAHTCHAHGCRVPVPARMFMCRTHWYSLREKTRNAIWREYREGQEVDKRPSLRYLAVQRFAVSEQVFRPNNEDAAKVAAKYMIEAQTFRQLAIDAGDGDPLAGLVEELS